MNPSLTVAAAARRLALALLCCLGLLCLLTPAAANARIEMSIGSGMTEGDPGDALGISDGGGGGSYPPDESDSFESFGTSPQQYYLLNLTGIGIIWSPDWLNPICVCLECPAYHFRRDNGYQEGKN